MCIRDRLIAAWLVTAAMMPHAGGQYVYLREALGPLWGLSLIHI